MSIILLLVALVITVALFITHYHISRDIEGWKERAQVSSEPNDMHEYMTNVKEGMEEWNMTEGNADILFPNPDNDMSLIYRAVQQHVDQAQILTDMNRSTPEYQTGLDNLRGSIRELNLEVHDYWNWHQGFLSWVALVIVVIFGAISIFISVEWSFFDD
jgi:hypothetical protein